MNRQQILFALCLSPLLCYADPPPINPMTQTLQVNTHFSRIIGKPSWLLIIRDVKSGQVHPYLFDIRNDDNFWVAFSGGRAYQVTSSQLKFGPYAKINNFCGLEKGIIDGESMWITLRGELSPNPSQINCHVSKYKNMQFPIVKKEETTDAPGDNLRTDWQNALSPLQPNQPKPSL